MSDITSPKTRWWDIAILVALVIVIATKTVALFTGLYACDGDEAIIGIMAKHILAGKGHPIYMYGQSYGAGAGLEAHLAAGIMAITGKANILAVKLVAALIFAAFLFMLWMTTKRFRDKSAANMTLLLAAASPTMAIWFSKLRGGHITALVITMAAFRIALKLLPSEENRQIPQRGKFFVLGLLAAAAAWCQPLAAPPLVILLAVVVMAGGRRIFRSGELLLMLLGIFIPTIPLIMAIPDSITWSAGSAGLRTHQMADIWAVLKTIPGLFGPFLDSVSPSPPIWIKLIGWFWAAATLIALAALFKNFIGCPEPSSRFKLLIVLLSPISVLIAAFGISQDITAPRHFIAAYPFCCIAMGVFLSERVKNPGRVSIFSKTITCLLIISAIAVNIDFSGSATIYGAGTQVRPMPARDVTMLIQSLDSRGAKYTYCLDYMLKWNIVFESNERIITSGLNAKDRYQPYVNLVNEAAASGVPVPMVVRFPPKSLSWARFENLVKTDPNNATRIGDEIFIIRRQQLQP